MKFPRVPLFVIFLAFVAVGCEAPEENDNGTVRAGIEAANAKWMHALEQGDAEELAAIYTTDTQLLPPNSGMLSGRDAVRKVFQGMMDAGIQIKLQTVEVESLGGTAVEIGNATVIGPDGQTLDSGKYLVTWKKVGEDWKMHRDIWNSSLPQPGAGS